MLEPGKYVVAVSGGVDSVVLLDLLSNRPGLHLVVAHLDHGIRPDSAQDAIFVMELTHKYHLPFIGASIQLGSEASEEEARKHRYDFLGRAMKDCGAQAIITAHHQDDLIETAIINTLRGTGRKGLSSLRSTTDIRRPLLHVSKQEILQYASDNSLVWREDPTNKDPKYVRNRIRQTIKQNLDVRRRTEALSQLSNIKMLNEDIDQEIAVYLQSASAGTRFKRAAITQLPHAVAREVLAYWLRENKIYFDKKILERVLNHIKVSRAGNKVDVSGNRYILIEKQQISLKSKRSV